MGVGDVLISAVDPSVEVPGRNLDLHNVRDLYIRREVILRSLHAIREFYELLQSVEVWALLLVHLRQRN